MFRFLATTSLLSLTAAALTGPAGAVSEHREKVLGTSFDMTVHGVAPEAAKQIFDETLAEIKRLEGHFSPKGEHSELKNLKAGANTLSPDMVSLLQACEAWRTKTENALSCRIGPLQAAWDNAAATGALPDREYMKRIAREVEEIDLAVATHFTLPDGLSLDPTGLAKGYILDRALEKARAIAPNVAGIKIDIGGDAVYWGSAGNKVDWTIAIADPHNPQDNGEFLTSIALQSKAIASSGHQSRTIKVADRNYSQIVNPRTGWVMEEAPAATVVADDAITADALATALSTMPIKEGLKLVNGMDGVEALIVAADKRLFPSKGWRALEVNAGIAQETVWRDDYAFNIDFTIPEVKEGNYKRPYVGIWVTTPKKKLVKSLMLLGESRRWMEENYVWWRRYGRKVESIVDGVSRPTRMPGHYQVAWDGRDDFGNAVEDGDYILHVEMSREHGDHTYKRFPIKIGAGAFTIDHAGEGEIGALTVKFSAAKSGRRG